MVNYPDKKPLPPYLANVPQRPQPNPRELTFSRLRGSYVSKHRGGKSVTVVLVTDSFGADLALLFKTPLNEDLDGAPTSFAPPIDFNDPRPWHGMVALDDIRNATDGGDHPFHEHGVGNTFHWTGVMSAPNGNIDDRDFLRDGDGNFPLFQPPGSPTHDFYAPRTAMVGADGQAVNPLVVPYAALSTSVRDNGHVALGDVGVAVRTSTGASTGFLYGDAGGRASTSVGECSRMMIRNLFGGAATNEDILYIVFPGVSAGNVAHPELVEGLVRQNLARLAQFDNYREVVRNLFIPLVLDRSSAMAAARDMALASRGMRPAGINPTIGYVQDVEDTADFRRVLNALGIRGFQPPP
jgi:hypothetical protein